MSDQIRVDIQLLKEHVDIVQNEYRIACEIAERIQTARQVDDVSFTSQYSRLHRHSRELEEHFAGMITAVEELGNIFDALNRKIEQMLEDGLEKAQL